MKSTRLATLCAALGLALFLNSGAQAQISTSTDSTGDIDPGITTGGGTLDIVKMDVVDTETDVVFTLTVNGDFRNVDWGNYMIGIANQKTPGSTLGNGWGRPISINAGVTNGVTNGMTHWIGSWVGSGGGNQLWTYAVGGGSGTGNNWSGPVALTSFSTTAASQSKVVFTVSKTSLGVTNGDTIKYDAYSSGGGGGDSAVDSLANTNVSITSWGQSYISQGANLRSYTLANTALNTTADVTFSVNMNGQRGVGAFNANATPPDLVSVEWGTGTGNFAYLTDADADGIYTGTAAVSAPNGTPVTYKFVIEPGDQALPVVRETSARSLTMQSTAQTLATVPFNDIGGYRDVTFAVDMSAQTTLGAFNPATQTVEVRGLFNGWTGTTLTDQGSGIYSGTVRIAGTANQSVGFKFFTAGTNAVGYEDGGDRTFTLAFNSGLTPTPALVLTSVPFFRNEARNVTFAVDMNRQIALGNFLASTGTVEIRGAMNSWTGGASWQLTDADADGIYTGTFSITGAAGSTLEYKFVQGTGGWESVPNRSFTLGAAGTGQSVPVVFFNNDSGQTRDVTFAVDMSVQAFKGLFNTNTGTVELRGIGSFGPADAKPLTREGSTQVFKGTYAVPGDAGTSFGYKFFSSGVTAGGYELISADAFVNRSLTLGTSGVTQILDTAFFSNLAESRKITFRVDMSIQQQLGNFIPGTDSVKVAGNFNGWTGVELAAQGNGIYAGEILVDGAVSDIRFKFLSKEVYEAVSERTITIPLTNLGASMLDPVYFNDASTAGSTFASWSSNGTLNAANLAKYAIGGASSLTANDGQASAVGGDANTLTLTAIVRTDDNTVTITGEASTDLGSGWSSSGVTVSDTSSQADVPLGCTRKVFSVNRGSDAKKFIRIKATKP